MNRIEYNKNNREKPTDNEKSNRMQLIGECTNNRHWMLLDKLIKEKIYKEE